MNLKQFCRLPFVRRFTDRRGAVAIIFALTIIPLLGVIGLAIDVGSAVWAQGQLNISADVAVMTAVTKGANDYLANSSTSFVPAQQAGVQRFQAQADTMPSVNVTSVGVAVTKSGTKIQGVATYTAKYQTYLASLLGVPTLRVSGASNATRPVAPFIEISILMDTSSSMGIAATQSGMTQLGQWEALLWYGSWAEQQNCAFGCHFSATGTDAYSLAKLKGISLRIDVIKQAITSMVQSISQSPSASQFKVGLYTFNLALQQMIAPSNNFSGVTSAANGVTLPLTTSPDTPDTNFPAALASLTSIVPASGDGSSAASPLRYVFILSDGVVDYGTDPNRVLGPVDPTMCDGLKAKGVQILTLYTDYIPLQPPNVPQANPFYVTTVAPFQSQIQPGMQACASSLPFAFEASDPVAIQAAVQAMLLAAETQPARLTQ